METRSKEGNFPQLLSSEVLGFDKFGFAIFHPGHNLDSERHHVYKRRVYPKEETLAWEKLFEEWEANKNKLSSKLPTYMRRGVPIHMRSQLWNHLLDTEALRSTVKFNYQEELGFVRRQLVDLGISEYGGQLACNYLSDLEMGTYRVRFDDVSMDALRHIFLDLDRSYPTHRMFMGDTPEAKEGRASLFRVLATYARYNKKVEYCQGMAAIAGMFLMQMDNEEEAFWCLLSLLERQKYLLGYFHDSMDRIKKHACVFNELLSQRFPKLEKQLTGLGINPLMYLTPWFMVLYTSLPCWDTVLAIWDLLLMDGNKTVFQVALSLLETFEEDVLTKKDICDVLPVLLHPPIRYVEFDTLMPVVWSTHIENWEISSLLSVLSDDPPCSPKPPAKLAQQPASGQKRKRSEGDSEMDKKVVRFTGEQDKTKRMRVLSTGTAEPATVPVKETSVFKRFVNIFTPKPVEAVSPRAVKPHIKPRRASAKILKEKRQTLRRSQQGRDQLIIPGRRESQKTLNIDKVPNTNATENTFSLKINANSSLSHPLRSLPSSIENSPVESGEDRTPTVEKVKAGRPDISPCMVADENSFIENDRLSALKIGTPMRRSPRLMEKRALKDVNSTNITINSVVSQPMTRHTFQAFKSATPLRRSQRVQIIGTPPFVTSPEVEMRPLKRR